MMEFTQKDLQQIKNKGLSLSQVEKQIERFKTGFPYANIIRTATPEDGVICLDQQDQEKYMIIYEKLAADKKMIRFVPASGAATRMFRDLFAAREKLQMDPEANLDEEANRFMLRIKDFAFYGVLSEITRAQGWVPEQMTSGKKRLALLNFVLDTDGLGYGQKPKGQILFHDYPDGPRTAFEEHLAEAAAYVKSASGVVENHFTVSPQHQQGFEQILKQRQAVMEEKYDVHYRTTFSIQKPSTDTIAVDPDNKPFRLDDGTLLFRPGGHGALIENLNDLDADIFFIKNIDNVTPDHYRGDTVKWKKLLGGLLLDHLGKIYRYQKLLKEGSPGSKDLAEMIHYAREHLKMDVPADTNREKLNEVFFRPVRVCGMVRNEGEPGGGPFWVRGHDGKISLQIVESAQIDPDDPVKQKIMSGSTHFNPVDLVCAVKDYSGRKYDLRRFVDPETGFISKKSYMGRDLKALELPGLWNGAMAGWITLFVEVPPTTFTPVKTVNDLLRKEHQPF